MNIQAYIESGILENYVLGLLSQKEELEVAHTLLKYPVLQKEKELIEDTLYTYALSFEKQVPVNMEASILSKINEQSSSPSVQQQQTNTGNSSDLEKYLITAFFLAAIGILSYLSFDNYTKGNEINALNQNYQALELDCKEKEKTLIQLQKELEILRAEDNIQIKMKGTDKVPQAIANVIYNPEKKESYLDVLKLPKPPSDKQYQLWAIVDGNPVDMGVFDLSIDPNNNLQKVPFIENPQAFAITLEQKGGSPTPTLEEMYVIGYVAG